MKARRRTIVSFLAAVLLASAVVPCGLIEAALESVPRCTVADGPVNSGGADEAPTDESATAGLDCCAACLACCASFLGAARVHLAAALALMASPVLQPPHRLPGTRLPIWHPPRA